MNTGLVDNWLNVDTFGPIYPFVGMEGLMAIVGIAFWIGWHIIQIRKENTEFKQDVENINAKGGVDKILADEVNREIGDSIGR